MTIDEEIVVPPPASRKYTCSDIGALCRFDSSYISFRYELHPVAHRSKGNLRNSIVSSGMRFCSTELGDVEHIHDTSPSLAR